ncbi:hypothetical protein SAMN02745136_02759 [Anaerocolumna jejuensis DSM 15929]|uniref:Uncharacterized protein n=1 Tax=Anaerocolumna jejuensis DSM 15929 TaxID=1121322 RepID=A0A1M6TDS6_9FIRM|nr:hypothetical protein [Anaerocolumna jejuensis]SHK55123.1 hypothetical protein SAMN02745136_02759 [Anaerocolumna jejuensis DSM 15929]
MNENIYKFISVASGVIAILITYFNKKNTKREKLYNDYFKKLLIPYVAAYKVNANINPVRYVNSRFTRNDIYIPRYVFYLVDKCEKDSLHKVLISDYMSEFPTTSNILITTLSKIGNILSFIMSFIMIFAVSFMFLLTCYMIIDTISIVIIGNYETIMFLGITLNSISFNIILIVLCLFFGIVLMIILIYMVRSEEDRYKMSMKSINKNIKQKIKEYNNMFIIKNNSEPKYYL